MWFLIGLGIGLIGGVVGGYRLGSGNWRIWQAIRIGL